MLHQGMVANWEIDCVCLLWAMILMAVGLLSRALKCGRALEWESEKLGSGPESTVDCYVILDRSLTRLPGEEGTMVALEDIRG